MLQELLDRASVSCLTELGDGELGGQIDAHEEVELSLGGRHLVNAPSFDL